MDFMNQRIARVVTYVRTLLYLFRRSSKAPTVTRSSTLTSHSSPALPLLEASIHASEPVRPTTDPEASIPAA